MSSTHFQTRLATIFADHLSGDQRGDLDRWETDGGCESASAAEPHLYGKRLERDGSWSIYQLFTGLPAHYGTWNLSGLTRPVADRALRIVNLPPASGDH